MIRAKSQNTKVKKEIQIEEKAMNGDMLWQQPVFVCW